MSQAERATILIIDDDETSRDLVQRKLCGSPRVLHADNGPAGLDLVQTEPVDLVILDVMLPELNGFEVCSRIKAGAQDAFLPVILITALHQQDDRNKGLAAGADEFLSKPVNAEELNLRARALLHVRGQDTTIRRQSRSLQRSNQRLAAVNKVGALLASSLQIPGSSGAATSAIVREFALDLAAIGVRTDGELVPLGAAPDEKLDEARELMATPSALRALETREFQVDPESGVCWAPLIDIKGTLGVLVARSGSQRRLDDDDHSAIATIAAQFAMALRTHEFIEQIRSHSEELEEAVRERTASLERQIQFTGQIIDSLPVSLHVVDRDRTVVAWNRQRELGRRGVSRDQAIGRSLYEIFDRQSRSEMDREFEPVFERGEKLYFERESQIDDDLRHFRVHKLPMRLEPGEVTHVITIGEDITEQRRMEKTITLTEKMAAVGRVAAGVAHEINNPLATIATCAEALQGRLGELDLEPDASSDFLEYLGIVQQEAYRAKKITQGMLDFSRTKPSSRAVQELEDIVQRTLHLVQHHAGFRNIDVEQEFEEGIPPVCVEEDAIVQVLMVLILNALDAMPDGGKLGLATRIVENEAHCTVRDSGCGIAASARPNIFEPFFTTKPPGRGTGLGLAVAYGIVKSHGGRIEVDSKPGQGSLFTIVLPAVAESPLEPKETLECQQAMPSGS